MKKLSAKFVLMILSVVFVMPFVVSCGERNDTSGIYSTYVYVMDNLGNIIKLRQNTSDQFVYDYDEEMEYKFRYAEYSDNGYFLAEGDYENTVQSGISGTTEHLIKVPFTDPKTNNVIGQRYYRFYTVVKENTAWATPEVYFDLRGATVEGEGDDLKYVYKLYSCPYASPLLYLRYEGEEIRISDKASHIVGWSFKDSRYIYEDLDLYNTSIGEYWVYYDVGYSGYLFKEDKAKYKEVHIRITVEIRK